MLPRAARALPRRTPICAGARARPRVSSLANAPPVVTTSARAEPPESEDDARSIEFADALDEQGVSEYLVTLLVPLYGDTTLVEDTSWSKEMVGKTVRDIKAWDDLIEEDGDDLLSKAIDALPTRDEAFDSVRGLHRYLKTIVDRMTAKSKNRLNLRDNRAEIEQIDEIPALPQDLEPVKKAVKEGKFCHMGVKKMAGDGKTTSCFGLADLAPKSLYLVFNKTAQEDATARSCRYGLSGMMTCKTNAKFGKDLVLSLKMRPMKKHRAKLSPNDLSPFWKERGRKFPKKSEKDTMTERGVQLPSSEWSDYVPTYWGASAFITLQNFMRSKDAKVTCVIWSPDAEKAPQEQLDYYEDMLLDDVQMIWDHMSSPDKNALISPDLAAYQKKFQLAMRFGPDPQSPYHQCYQAMMRKHNKPSLILNDEAQDANPAMADGVLAYAQCLDCPLVSIGDSYQRINSWNGAIDSFEEIPDDDCIRQNGTRRCSEAVVELANHVLTKHDDSEASETDHQIMLPRKNAIDEDELASDRNPGAVLVLFRTNSAMLECAIDLHNNHRSFYFQRGPSKLIEEVRIMESIHKVMDYERGQQNPRKQPMRKSKRRVDYSESDDDDFNDESEPYDHAQEEDQGDDDERPVSPLKNTDALYYDLPPSIRDYPTTSKLYHYWNEHGMADLKTKINVVNKLVEIDSQLFRVNCWDRAVPNEMSTKLCHIITSHSTIPQSTLRDKCYILATAHTSKGTEAWKVYIAEDFAKREVRTYEALLEELRLLYVAITRAREAVWPKNIIKSMNDIVIEKKDEGYSIKIPKLSDASRELPELRVNEKRDSEAAEKHVLDMTDEQLAALLAKRRRVTA